MDYNQIYKKVEHYVTGLFEKSINPNLIYHNLPHTKGVVSRTKEIAGHYDLDERNMLIVYVAAWFHDTGYLFTEPAYHEERSCELMRKFMKDYTKDEELISEIEQCIMATKPGAPPTNLCEEILKDADTFHFGTKEFKVMNKLVFAENTITNPNFNKNEAYEKVVQMLEHHQFFTSYCREQLNEQKQKNINKLKKKIKEEKEKAEKEVRFEKLEKEVHDKEEKEKEEKEDKWERNGPSIKEKNALVTKGIQTMLRLTSENQMKLSDMADHKANILISVNSIIISVILGVLLRKIQDQAYLTVPTIIFLIVSVVTVVISILATRPKLSSGRFSEQDVIDKKTNLLFFGNFHKATFEQYELAMRKMMKDPDYLYGAVVRDIYQLAVVLGRKYRLIRLAYNIFMIGIVISVLAFAIATFFLNNDTTVVTNASGSPL